ncbi:hypothetical protein, variant [Capsaspora owczarzaki ATCC 30864]|uniref:Uncharacterized protein n=1 Tax=Capsaspora owczarzaki (strain ATCC 30864) TaxID=595528 RepID=A0A0D2VPK5_CAPO3|nr:hypothetical protein, variant [Capsaspora owczarzaki ATCC 30864]
MPPKAAPPAAAEPLAAAEPHAEESHDTEPDWSTLSASNVFSESFLEYNRGRESHLRDLMRKSKDLGKEVDALKTQHTSTQEALRHFRALRDDLTAGTDRLERGAKAAQQEIYTKLKRFSEHGIQGEPGTPAFMENLVKSVSCFRCFWRAR